MHHCYRLSFRKIVGGGGAKVGGAMFKVGVLLKYFWATKFPREVLARGGKCHPPGHLNRSIDNSAIAAIHVGAQAQMSTHKNFFSSTVNFLSVFAPVINVRTHMTTAINMVEPPLPEQLEDTILISEKVCLDS